MSAWQSIVEWMVNVSIPWEVSHVTVIRDTWPIKVTFVLVGVTWQGNAFSVFRSKIILKRPMSFVTLSELLKRHSALSPGTTKCLLLDED